MKYIELSNVLGKSKATNTTVHLFNSVLPIKKDNKGTYIEIAIKPHKNGVLIKKKYIE